MISRTRTTLARVLAPALFVVAAAVEVGRLVLGRPWKSFVPSFSNGLGVVLAALWLASAVLIFTGSKRALAVPVLGTLMLFTMGVVYRAGGSIEGLLYMGLAPVIVLLERYSFAGFLDPSALTDEKRHA
jgi:hypothetical protein